MARMPQIPQPEFGERPDGRVERTPGLDLEAGGARALAEGAEGVSEVAGQRAKFQAQQAAADEKLQRMADEVTATKMAGDHSEKMRQLLDQVREENVDTPEQIPEKFRLASQEQTDAEINASTNQQVAMLAAQKYATIDDQQLAAAHSLSRLRVVQKAKDNFTKLGDTQVQSAQAQGTLAGLEMVAQKTAQDLGPLAKNLHEDGQEAMEKINHRQALGWVDANSEKNPSVVKAALDKKDSFLTKNMSAEELREARKRNLSDFKNYEENQKWKLIQDSAYRGNRAWDLYTSGELNASNLSALQREYDSHDRDIDADRNLDDQGKERMHDQVDKDRQAAQYLYNATRRPGRFDALPDPQILAKLNDDVVGLTKAKNNSPKDLENFIDTRNKVLKSVGDHEITQAQGDTLLKSMSQMLIKAENREGKNTGWQMPFVPAVRWMTPQQFGNRQLNAAFDTVTFKNFSLEQKNHARYQFMQLMVDARQANPDANFDDNTVRQMVQQSLEYARSHK